MFKDRTPIFVGLVSLALVACGGGDGPQAVNQDPPDASGAGIWSGTYKVDGAADSLPMFGIVTEESDFALVATGPGGHIFFGTGATNGNNFTANALAYQGATKTPSSWSGTIADRATITGSYSLTGESATVTLQYVSLYERAAAFATLTGVYTVALPGSGGNPGTTLTVDVNATGGFTYTSSGTGCMITGTFTIPHANRNYYRWTGTSAGCGAADGPLSGVAYLGDNTTAQNRVLTLLGQNQPQTAPLLVVVTRP